MLLNCVVTVLCLYSVPSFRATQLVWVTMIGRSYLVLYRHQEIPSHQTLQELLLICPKAMWTSMYPTLMIPMEALYCKRQLRWVRFSVVHHSLPCSQKQDVTLVKALVALGANVNYVDKKNMTAFDVAIRGHSMGIADLLKSVGGLPFTALPEGGGTVMDTTSTQGEEEMRTQTQSNVFCAYCPYMCTSHKYTLLWKSPWHSGP